MNQELENLMTRAYSALLSRDFVLAKRLYKTILKADKNNIQALLHLGSVYVKENNDREALDVYKSVLEIDRENFTALNELGGIYRRLEMYDESIDVLETAFALGEHLTDLYYNMGHTYKLKNDFENALLCFEKVIEENPSDVLAYNHLGSIHAQLGNHAEALVCYQKGLQLDPNHPILHYNAARSYRALKKYEEARFAFEAALRSRPGWVEVMAEHAQLLQEMDVKNSAIDMLQQALAFSPNDDKLQGQLAHLFYDNRQIEEAQNLYEQLVKKDENNVEANIGLAHIYGRCKKYFEAASLLRQIVGKYPDNKELQFFYTKMLILGRELREAASRLKQMRKADPENIDSLNLLGQFYILENDDLRVQHCKQRIETIDPSYTLHLKDFSQLYYDIDDFVNALSSVKEYNQAVIDKDTLYMQGELSEKLNDYDDALAIYQKLLAMDSGNTELIQKVAYLRDGLKNPPLEKRAVQTEDAQESNETLTQTGIDLNPEEDFDFLSKYEEKSGVFDEDLSFETEDIAEEDKDLFFDLDPLSDDLSELTDKDVPFDYNPEKDLDTAPTLDDFPEDSFSLDDDLLSEKESKKERPLEEPVQEKENEQLEDSIALRKEDLEKLFSHLNERPIEPDLLQKEVTKTEESETKEISFDEENLDNSDDSFTEDSVDFDTSSEEEKKVNEQEESEQPEVIQEEVLDNTEDETLSEELPADEDVQDSIYAILKAIENTDLAENYKDLLNLLKYLRTFGDYLPDFQKEAFLVSFDKIRLDALISKMSGKPGLLASSKALRQSGILDVSSDAKEHDVYLSDIAKLISYLMTLVKDLDDEFTAMGLATMLSNFLHRWGNAEIKDTSSYEEF
ncbi:MAG: tetratricopeptide repeat protein [Spirochaetaceae bacterium]|nr:tetratricopeptide repeat protein [Spirochaetaceae bacterium]